MIASSTRWHALARAVPASVILLVALAAPPAGAATAPFVIEQLDVAYRFENDGTYTHTVRARLHVQSEEGRRTLGEFYFPYQERSSRLELRHLRTIKPSGEAIEAATDRMFDVAPPSGRRSPVFSDLKYKAIPVPGLQVGDRIEYELLRTTHAPLAPGEFWGHHTLTRHVAVGRETVKLDLPDDRAIAFEADPSIDHTVERRDGRTVHRWTTANPLARAADDRADVLFNLSTFRTWPEVGAWLDGLIADRAVGNDSLTALAQQLVGDATDPKVKVDRLYTYVAQSVRYVQVRLGIGSYQPHAAADVQRNLYGDCKDKHTLLAVLLAAVGIESRPALVHTQQSVDPQVPSPEAFNHMITVIDLGEDELWLDATEELAPPGWLAPQLRGGRALVARKNESRLERVPATVPVADSRRAVLRGSIDAAGDLHADLRVEHRGSFEVGWRNLFHEGTAAELQSALQVDRPPTLRDATVGVPTSSDPLDTDGPFVVEYTLDQPGWLDPAAATRVVILPSMILTALAQATPQAGNDHGTAGLAFRDYASRSAARANAAVLADGGLAGPLVLEERVQLTAPPGLTIEAPPDVLDERPFASYTATYTSRDGTFEAQRTLEVASTRLRPAQREELIAFVRSMQGDIERRLIVHRPAPTRQPDPE